MRRDIRKGIDVIGEFIDDKNWVINYPYGNYNEAVYTCAAGLGANLGLTTEVRVACPGRDMPMTLPRLDCNIGELTIPLSFLCKSVTGIDGDTCITHLKKRISGIHNISLYAGDFFEADVTGKFDCVLIYSVIHYLDNYDRALKFILKAASLLKSGGRMLVGDIPNRSKQKRFLKSELGQKDFMKYMMRMF